MTKQEKNFLLMYFTRNELKVISATRSLKSISRIAENVEVVTASDIELMNAHTLADVLNHVNGVEVSFAGASPTSIANVSIEGSKYEEVAFFMDGVPLNLLDSNVVTVSDIPVQMIKRVEIIEGPASSSWGSSLGGVVNIITKSTGDSKKVHGTLSASYGERDTKDIRGEASGKIKNLGFYVTAGRLDTNGLRSYEDAWQDNLYAKLHYDVSRDTGLLFTLGYDRKNRKRGDTTEYDFLDRDKVERLFSTLSLKSGLSRELELDVSLRAMHQMLDYFDTTVSTGGEFSSSLNEYLYGTSARLVWKHGSHDLVMGSDYDDGTVKADYYPSDQHDRRWSVYANDTIAMGKFTVTPGIRYDNSNLYEGFVSPSLGATCELWGNTLLRVYVARGFNAPSIDESAADYGYFVHNPNLEPEKVWSYQAGIETGMLRYVWLKITGFRHDIKNGIEPVSLNPGDPDDYYWTYDNVDKVRRQGMEVQMKTVPLLNTVLFAGATFVHSENRVTGEDIKGVPKYTYDLGVRYDQNRSFSALLQGHYIWFNEDSRLNPKYSSFIFDLNLVKKVYLQKGRTVSVFATAHNIFNGSQYWADIYKNASRWFEAGLRYKF